LALAWWPALRDPVAMLPASLINLRTLPVNGSADSAVRTRLADLGQEIFPREQQTPAALGAFQKAEIEKWWPIIKAANIKVE